MHAFMRPPCRFRARAEEAPFLLESGLYRVIALRMAAESRIRPIIVSARNDKRKCDDKEAACEEIVVSG